MNLLQVNELPPKINGPRFTIYQMERTLYDLQKRRRITDCKSPETYILNNQFMTHKKWTI